MANQDEHVIDYYLRQSRLLLAKTSNRLMKEARCVREYKYAIGDVQVLEHAIQDLCQKINNRRALRRS